MFWTNQDSGSRSEKPQVWVFAAATRPASTLALPLAGEWPYLWLDATYLKVRQGGRTISVAAILAVAVNTDGRREIRPGHWPVGGGDILDRVPARAQGPRTGWHEAGDLRCAHRPRPGRIRRRPRGGPDRRRWNKGLYKKARAGEIENFTGISSPYEAPRAAEIRIDTTQASAEEAADQIVAWLEERGYLE